MAGRLGRGEVRLFRFPAPDKERPVLILTRGSALDYLSRVTVAPITSTVRGVPSEVILGLEDGMKRVCVVNLHNLVTVPQASVGRRLVQLTPQRLREVCAALAFALGCEV
jgi:mRNA interferase MazF